MTGDYYSDWDRWFAEEHDGTPVEWTVCSVDLILDGEDTGHISLCAARGAASNDPELSQHNVVHRGEKHNVLHRFTASSLIEACQKQYEAMGWGEYIPHPDWDIETGRWKK